MATGYACFSLVQSTPLTDVPVDRGVTATRLSGRDKTFFISQQLTAVRTRHAPSAVSTWSVTSQNISASIQTNATTVNILTKIDNLKAVGGADLPFNLDFYTEVQDLHYLLPQLSAEQGATGSHGANLDKLNEALIQLVDDFGLVGFETLAVEDRASMASLLRAIDRASGHAFAGARATDEEGRTLNDEASIWAAAMSDHWAGKMEVRDVQERWIERKEEFDEAERKEWEEEARMAGATPSATAVRTAAEKATKDGGGGVGHAAGVDEDDDELLAEQRRWEAQVRQAGGGGGTKVERKG